MENNTKTYITDVLVVGGGLGGAVMAQKRAKSPRKHMAVISPM